MRVLFAGPTLAGLDPTGLAGLQLRPPAGQGDVAAAVLDGATAIGLVDGVYEGVAAVWHKEILFALERGVAVLGAASMGALRAAECDRYGMEGIGDVYRLYRSGALVDDDAVAQVHAPADLGYTALNEALVNVTATLDRLLDLGLVTTRERDALATTASRLFFKRRTWPAILAGAGLEQRRREAVAAAAGEHRVDLKRADALSLVERLRGLPVGAGGKSSLAVPRTHHFRMTLEALARDRDPA